MLWAQRFTSYAGTEFKAPIKKLTAISTLILPTQFSGIVERMMASNSELHCTTPTEVAAALEP